MKEIRGVIFRVTYNKPAPISAYSATFFFPATRKVCSMGNGKTKIIASVAILTAALAYATSEILRQ